MQSIKPDEVYNLAARSFVGVSFELYQAFSSEMFGKIISLLSQAFYSITNSPQEVSNLSHARYPEGWPESN